MTQREKTMSKVQRGFDAALAASLLSNAPRPALRLGASLFAGARLLSVGCNWYGRSHPESSNSKDFVRSTHAEHQCLVRRQWKPVGNLTMYVGRLLANGTLGNSRPCANCLALAKLAGVRRVWFYGASGKQEEIIL